MQWLYRLKESEWVFEAMSLRTATADPHCEIEKVGELVDTITYMHTDLYIYT
jgi:hypothetical protein